MGLFPLVAGGEGSIVNKSDSHLDVDSKCIQLQQWANSITGKAMRISTSIPTLQQMCGKISWEMSIDNRIFYAINLCTFGRNLATLKNHTLKRMSTIVIMFSHHKLRYSTRYFKKVLRAKQA